jgi:LacI family transcriptional regulator
MASIKDVANRAGVSITTVSRALNNYSDVSPKTKKRILEICEELHYTPNPSARNLALKKSSVIGFVFSDVKETDMNGNIIYRLLLGAQAGCEERGYELIILFINKKKQEEKSFRDLCKEKNMGSAVVYGLKSTDPYYRQLSDLPIPCVGIDVDKAPVMVGTNNDQAVEELIEFFYSRGKRRIAMINGSFEADISRIRETAFIRAMRKMKLDLPQKCVRYADFFEEKAYLETKELLKEKPDIDGIFAASDLMAIGVMRALKELKCHIPGQIAVAGMDGIQVGAYMDPPLTTVFQDFKAMGYKAVNMVADMHGGKEVSYIEYVDHQLLIRESV